MKSLKIPYEDWEETAIMAGLQDGSTKEKPIPGLHPDFQKIIYSAW